MKDALIKYKRLTFWSFARCVVMLISVSVIPASLAGQSDEIDVTVNGKLKIVQIDHDPGAMKPDEVLYLLEDEETHKTFTLRFEKKAPRHLRSGMKITARGKSKGQELLLAADGDGSQSITVNSAPARNGCGRSEDSRDHGEPDGCQCHLFGRLCSGSDVQWSQPAQLTASTGKRPTMRSRLPDRWLVLTPSTTAAASATIASWTNAADAAARADGINIDAYSRKVYVMPSVCPFSGVGEVGTNPSRAWVFRCDFADTFAHELGHNLGMQHAATPGASYGDISDIMGGGGRPLRQINAPHKEQMGWIPSQEVMTVTNSRDLRHRSS